MPTLRRSKSLNDKISRQKNRIGDVIRDPRSPEVEGRTRQCVDNFQALVHLRKQTEDKARQLDLALSYAVGNVPRPSVNLPPGPAGGVEIPFYRTQYRNSGPPCPEGRGPGLYRRQRSADNRASQERGESSSDVIRGQTGARSGSQNHLQQQKQHLQHPPPPPPQLSQRVSCVRPQQQHQQQQQQQRVQRPMSMYETRPACVLPSREELAKKEQVIQNMSESQRILGLQNEALLSRVEELEFQTAQLRKILAAHNIPYSTLPITTTTPAALPPKSSAVVSSCPVTPLTAGRPSFGGAVHVKGEHSVSGYSSLAESACNGGVERAMGSGVGRLEERGSEEAEAANADRGWEVCAGERKLSRAESVVTLESRMSTLARSVSSCDTFSVSTLPPDTDLESLHEVLDRALQREQSHEASFCTRIDELEKKVAEVTLQKAVVLRKYGEVLDQNLALRKCVQKAGRELRALTLKQRDPKFVVSHAELHAVLGQLQCAEDEAWSRLDRLFAPSPSTNEPRNTAEAVGLSGILDRVVDFVGWDSQDLARKLGVDLQEATSGSRDMTEERRCAFLEDWLMNKAGDNWVNLSEHLGLMLENLDTDIRLFDRTPVQGPERQALRNTLSYVTDHVTEAQVVQNFVDELTVLDVLTTEDVAFVRQVSQSPERALVRVWHVAQYCGTGIVASMAHALERSGLVHVAIKLTDELELQNSRLHSLNRPATLETNLAKDSQTTESGPDFHMRRSRPSTRSFRSKVKGETLPLPDTDSRDSVWSRRLPAARVRGVVRGPVVVREGDRVSMV